MFGFSVSIVSTLSLVDGVDLEVVVDAGTVDVIKYSCLLATRTAFIHALLLTAIVAIKSIPRMIVEDLCIYRKSYISSNFKVNIKHVL